MDTRVTFAAAWMRQNWALCTVAAGGVVITAAIASMTSNYRPLLDQVQQRYLESEDRAAWQVAEREAAAQEAARQAEEQRQRHEAEAQRREEERLAQERATQQAEERRREEARRQAVVAEQARQRAAQEAAAHQQLVEQYQASNQALAVFIAAYRMNLDSVKSTLSQQSAYLQAYAMDTHSLRANSLTFDEVRSGVVCNRTPVGLKGEPRYIQLKIMIFGCAMYRVLDAKEHPTSKAKLTAMVAAYASYFEGRGYDITRKKPISRSLEDLFIYYWVSSMEYRLAGQATPGLPELYLKRGELNPAFLGGDSTAFLERKLIAEQLSDDEKQHFVTKIYPRLVELQVHAGTVARLCRALAMARCDNALTQYFAEAP